MRPYYAMNARQLLEKRKAGTTPAAPVVVSFFEGFYPNQETLFVADDMPSERMDWRMLVNLSVWVIVDKSVALEKMLETVFRIALAKPKELILRFEQGDKVHDIEVGYGHHLPAIAGIPAVHEFQWAPINVGGTAMGKRLVKALKLKKPNGVKL